MAQFVKNYVQDLAQDIQIRHCGTLIFNADTDSNVINVSLYNGQEEAPQSGSVACAVICSDGSTVPVTGGTISGNTVSVTLGADGLIPGQVGIGIQVISGDVKTTVFKAVYSVELFETDTVVDPSSRITISVGELVSDIETAVASIPADYSDLLAAIAPTFSTSTAYASGSYVWYSGHLYRFTAAHSAGAWVGTDAVQVALADDVSDLKSAFNDLIRGDPNIAVDIIPNEYVTREGEIKTYNGWSRTDWIDVSNYAEIEVKGSTVGSNYCCFFLSDKTYLAWFGIAAGTTLVKIPDIVSFIMISNTTASINAMEVIPHGNKNSKIIEFIEQLTGYKRVVNFDVEASAAHSSENDSIFLLLPAGTSYRVECASKDNTFEINIREYYADGTNSIVKYGTTNETYTLITAKDTIRLGVYLSAQSVAYSAKLTIETDGEIVKRIVDGNNIEF